MLAPMWTRHHASPRALHCPSSRRASTTAGAQAPLLADMSRIVMGNGGIHVAERVAMPDWQHSRFECERLGPASRANMLSVLANRLSSAREDGFTTLPPSHRRFLASYRIRRVTLVQPKATSAQVKKGKRQSMPPGKPDDDDIPVSAAFDDGAVPSNEFMIAMNRRLVSGEDDLENGPTFSSFKARSLDPKQRPSSKFLETVARRFSSGAGPRKYDASSSDEYAAYSTCAYPPPKGTSPYLSSMDSADAPSGPDPPPAGGMRPRNELMFDASKEYFREYRRIVFDFDYWSNMRSSLRFLFGILNMPRSFILQNVAVPVTFFTAWAAVAAGLHYADAGSAFAEAAPVLAKYFPAKFDDSPIALTASILPLLLVFRTNSSYGRFDEARKMWGLLLNRTRDLVRMAIAYFPVDEQHRTATFARWTIALSIALKCHLRPYDNLREDMEGLLTDDEANMFLSADHKVVCCIQVLSDIIEGASISKIQKLQLQRELTVYNDILGGSERLLRTPVPLSYTRNSSRFLCLCLFFFPLASVAKLGLVVVPVTAFISFLFLGIDEVGNEIEEPFSILPLEIIAAKSRADITELINNQKKNSDFKKSIDMDFKYPGFK